MGKILGIGLWVCIVTLGAVYGSIYLATAPEVASVTGQYFVNRRPQRTSDESYDEAAQERLWDLSARLTGLPSDTSQ